MGILRTREEYLPVTCAIMRPESRDEFFGAIKKQSQGRAEHIAKLCSVETGLVNDWMSGKSNVPYHFLQMLAHHYNITIPAVGELRREYLAVSQTATKGLPAMTKARAQAPKPARESREERRGERKPKAEKPRREPRPKPERKPRAAKPQSQPQPPKKPSKGKPAEPKGPRVPEPSEALAYWAGVAIMAARREPSELVMTADRHIGQNFAGSWAAVTRELFGVKPALKMVDDGKAQEARLPTAGFEEFFDRLELKAERKPGEAGVPRWAWSNPAWKAACVKGVVDACAHFQRAPALTLRALPERLARALEKMLASMNLAPAVAADGTVTLAGAELLDRYFEKVGTSNMKLRDQYKAYKNPRRGGGPPPPPPPEPREPGEPAPIDEQIEKRPVVDEVNEEEKEAVLSEKVEATEAEAEEIVEAAEEKLEASYGAEASPDENMEAAIDAAAAAKAVASAQPSRFGDPPPQPKLPPKPPYRRRTLYRGRPGKR